jgi:S1-C subfamily serine protease
VAASVSGGSSYSVGSGVIMREDGYILTNFHVVQKGSELTVMLLSDGGTYGAELVGYDEEMDIAILKIQATGLTAARFGDSDDLRVGDTAYAIGNPMGYLYGTMTDGIISAVDQEVEVGDYTMTLIQTSAALNSGNSGGALINEYGQVVGITVAKISGTVDSALVEGLGLAIPISAARPYINHILETGETWRPTIGITCFAVEADGVAGIQVETVDQDSPAFAAGLTKGDIIIEAQGKPVSSVYALKRVLGDVGADGELTCTILRDGEKLELTFALFDNMG